MTPTQRIAVDKRERTETVIKNAETAPQPAPAARLQELKDLKAKGLITEDEYEQKRKAIVDGL